MRWIETSHEAGEHRIKNRFLFLPKKLVNLYGKYEIRWLERTEWIQVYAGKTIGGFDAWFDTKWFGE